MVSGVHVAQQRWSRWADDESTFAAVITTSRFRKTASAVRVSGVTTGDLAWQDQLMVLFRVAWVVLAIGVVGLGSSVAAWPMYQITNCEIGQLTEHIPTAADCLQQSLWDYFQVPLLVMLGLPVALCLVAAIWTRPLVSWAVAGLFLLVIVVGFLSAIGAFGRAPNIAAALAGYPIALAAALLLAGLHQFVYARSRTRQAGRFVPVAGCAVRRGAR